MRLSGMKLKVRIILLVILCFAAFLLSSQEAPDTVLSESSDSLAVSDVQIKQDSLFYSADSVFLKVQENTIQLLQNATIKYHWSEISSNNIKIDLDNEKAFSAGKTVMQDRQQILIGKDVFVDIKEEKGLIIEGGSKFEKGYYYGNEIRKTDDKTFDIDYGKFTTCDSKSPHFHIQANKLRIYQDDKIVAKPVYFIVNHLPVFALPYGTFTIKRGRKTGILVPTPGYDNVRGKFIENIAFYLPYKDYADLTVALDYYEKTGWEFTFDTFYKKRYSFRGDVDFRLQNRIEGPQISRYEWFFKSKHHSDFPNRTTFDANLEFLSSTRILSGSVDIDERLNEKITSSMAFKKPLLGSYLNVSARFIDDLKNERKDLTLPSVSYSLPSKPVYELLLKDKKIPENAWWKGFSYSYSFNALHIGDINDPDASLKEILYESKKDSTGQQYLVQHNAGIQHYGKLSYSYKYRGWLNLTQSFNVNEAWFDRDKDNNKLVRGNDYKFSSTMSFSVYGIRLLSTPYIRAVRHIITPRLSFTYKPDFRENDKFYSFSNIGLNSTDRQRSISLGLTNLWQLKLWATKDLKERKLNDFIKITSSLNYNFETEGKGFSNISHNLDLNPRSVKFKSLTLASSPSGTITQGTYDLKFKDWDPRKWDWGISNWTFKLSSKLSFSGDASYNDYFPEAQNDFISRNLLLADTLSVEDERTITTLEEIEQLESERKNWSLNFSHTYRTNKQSFENNDYTSELRNSVTAKITKNWTISYDNYIDLKDEELVSHNFTITRDLHCWKIFFKYTKQGDYWSYQFKLFNVELPDDLKFSTRDNKYN
jgi:hypothetical protein